MKTYTETVGEAPFDWHHALSHPEEYELADLDDWAHDWVTCACGNQCAAIPRYSDGGPKDMELHDLGVSFYHCVADQDWDRAHETLSRIEARSAQLLAKP